MTGAEILDLPMGKNDADAETIREYLKRLLDEVWKHEEGFSGKRPFGNSGWSCELYRPLVVAKVIEGSLDEDGFLADFDQREGDSAIFFAISAL